MSRKCADCSTLVTEVNPSTGNYYARCDSCKKRNNEKKLTYYHAHKEYSVLSDDVTRTPYHMENFFRTKLSRWAHMPDWEDAVQEACIQAWKDEQQGVTGSKLQARGVMRGKAIALFQTGAKGGATMTGHVGRKSTEGTVKAAGEAKREKIRNYIEEFQRLHDRKPTYREVGNALGIDYGSVGKYVRSMYGSGVTVDASEVKVERLYSVSDDTRLNDDVSFAVESNPFVWEDDAVDKLTVESLMERLTEKQQRVVYMTYWLDMSHSQIANHLGVSRKTVREHLQAAYHQMRKVLT